MAEKHPTWTRKRFGKARVHWVAYDDRAEAGDRTIVDQGYAAGLVEADAAARAALAAAGLYGGRRTSTGFGLGARKPAAAGSSRPAPRREYLYTLRHPEGDEGPHVRAHLVIRKTPKRVFVSERSCWTAQLGTEDESWDPPGRSVALDRDRLERDGSAYATRFRESGFHRSIEGMEGDSPSLERVAFGRLGLRAPCTLEDIKAAYRRKALEVHPDRGGVPEEFRAVEDAYRKLLRAAGESA